MNIIPPLVERRVRVQPAKSVSVKTEILEGTSAKSYL